MIEPIDIFQPDEIEFRRHLVAQLETLDFGHESNAESVTNITNIIQSGSGGGSTSPTTLSGLSDTNITSVSDNDIIRYNSTTSLWCNEPMPSYVLANGTTTMTANWNIGNYNVGIGITPIAPLHMAESGTCRLILDSYRADTGMYSDMYFRKSNHNTVGTMSSTPDGSYLGSIHFNGVDTGSNFDYGAIISAYQSGAAGAFIPTCMTLNTYSATGYNSSGIKLEPDGEVAIGTSTNYTKFGTGGGLSLIGNARVYKNEWVDIGSFRVPGTNPAVQVDHGIADAWEFTDGVADTVYAIIRVPQDMDRSVAPEFKLGWDTDTYDPGDDSIQAKWQVEYIWRAAGESMIESADATLTQVTSAYTSVNGLVITTFTGVNAPSASDQLLLVRIKRRADEAADTLGDVAYLVGFGIKYVSDKLGVAF